MTYEGTLRSSFVVNGRRQDSEVWAILAEDWLKARA
jgi:RimJ/RimL family protein N-acetyltransferase